MSLGILFTLEMKRLVQNEGDLLFWMQNPGNHFGASKDETLQFSVVKTSHGSSFYFCCFSSKIYVKKTNVLQLLL